MALDERTLRYIAARMNSDAAERYASRPGAGGYANADRPTLVRALQELGGIGGQQQTIVPMGDRQQTINVNTAPSAPAGAARPSTPDESALASQAGWAGANEAVAPYLGDWRATPAQILAAAVGGYNRSRYAAQQDIAAQRQQQQLFDLKKQEMEAAQAAAQAKADQQQALMAEIDAIEDPTERRIAKLNPEGWAAAKAQQAMPEPISAFQEASLGLQRDRMAQEANEAAQRIALQRRQVELAGRADAEPLVAVQTPDGPRLLPRSQAAGLAPADTREQGGPKMEADLRKEFNNLPEIKAYKEIVPVVTSAINSAKRDDRASDLDLVFAVGKTLDPTSVVREGEQIMIMNAQSLPDWIQGAISGVSGGARLQPEVRRNLMSLLKSRATAWHDSAKSRFDEYSSYATDYQLDPGRSVPGLSPLPNFSLDEVPDPERAGQTMMNKAGAREPVPTINNGAPSPAAEPPDDNSEYNALFGVP
jgi:hypothetical protein